MILEKSPESTQGGGDGKPANIIWSIDVLFPLVG